MFDVSKIRQHIKSIVKDGLFRRFFKNTALLSGSKILAAVLGLAYLALAARALGVYGLGVLILINAYVIVIREALTFKSWQALIRYGAECLAQNRRADMQALVKFTLMLDIAGVVFATVCGVAAVTVIAPWFDLPPETIPQVKLYCVVILFSIKSTPMGLLRLFDRFDLLAKHALVIPIIRLTGVLIAFNADAGLEAYLLIWFLASAAGGLVLLLFGWQEFRRQGLVPGLNGSLRHLTQTHPRIWSFVWIANLQGTLNMTGSQLSTMIVGFILGPAGAGLFKIAQESASILTKPTFLFTQTIYPELAKLPKDRDDRHLWHVIVKSGAIALSIAGLVLSVIFLAGQALLALVFGEEFIGAYTVLLMLMFAGAIAMSTFSLEPAMYAISRPDIPLRIKLITSLIHIAATFIMLQEFGLIGAGMASILSTALTALLMMVFTVRLFKTTQAGN